MSPAALARAQRSAAPTASPPAAPPQQLIVPLALLASLESNLPPIGGFLHIQEEVDEILLAWIIDGEAG
jgi:hypothetical protein